MTKRCPSNPYAESLSVYPGVSLADWKTCQDCKLCETRTNVVRYRTNGKAVNNSFDLFFLGSAPTVADDVLGSPFVSESGKLLDTMLDLVWEMLGFQPTVCFSNMVACIPYKADDPTTQQARQPKVTEIKACADYVRELVARTNPKGFVYLGTLPYNNRLIYNTTFTPDIKLEHPSSILNKEGMLREKAMSTFTNLLLNFCHDRFIQ